MLVIDKVCKLSTELQSWYSSEVLKIIGDVETIVLDLTRDADEIEIYEGHNLECKT